MKPKTLTRSPSANSVENRPAKPKQKHPGLTEPKAAGQRKKWSDRVGERFGRLTVLRVHNRNHLDVAIILCQCDCGAQTKVQAGNLGRVTRSCGCLSKEMRKTCALKHGHKSGGKVSKLYRAWQSMKTRCYGHQKINHHYKENGIQVCEEWLNGDGVFSGFECFANYIKEPPSPAHTIERKNNLGDYEPGNVQWATRLVQGNNKSNNRLLAEAGRRLTVMQWSRVTGLSGSCILTRLRRGWSEEDAVTKPLGTRMIENTL